MPNIPGRMHAMVLTGHGGFDRYEYRDDWLVPTPAPGEVLLKVLACGLNNTDVNTRTAWYSKAERQPVTGESPGLADTDDATWGGRELRFPRIQGADVCARVAAVGDGVTAELVGKRVLVDTWLRDWRDPHNIDKCGFFGSECDGGYAEYSKTHARQVHVVNSRLSAVELATFPTSYITAENMLRRANVTGEDTVLIPGASGGVGSALIQLAKRRGATAIALCNESKFDLVTAIGADAVLPRTPGNLKSDLKRAIGRDQVTVVADVVGGDLWPSLINTLARGGRYTCAGAIAGPLVAFDLRTFYLRDLTFTGATVVPPGLFADVVGYIERDEIKPLLAKTFPLSEVVAAQQAFLNKHHVGNIVVVVAE